MTGSSLLWKWLTAFRAVNRYGRNFTATEMGILFSVATRANPDGSGIYRGIRGVATDTGSKADTVTKALAKARDMRVIERVRHGRRGTEEADSYALVRPADWCLMHDMTEPPEEPPY